MGLMREETLMHTGTCYGLQGISQGTRCSHTHVSPKGKAPGPLQQTKAH